ncbi:MAG: alkaline phosphatase [Balneola sp.]
MKIKVLILVLTLSIACSKSQEIQVKETTSSSNTERLPIVTSDKIKNVILLIGDGTGIAQISSGQLSLVGADGYLNLQRMPVTGIIKTQSSNSLITDSAAGATAYSCGMKTDNGMIAYLPDGKHCKTLLELAEEKGLSTGLVATSTITHATPASFAAHVRSRNNEAGIADDYVDSGVEVFLGGGREFFIPQDQEGSSREDDRNLVEEFENQGYEFLTTAEEMKNSTSKKVLGLFADSGMESENRTPTLSEMTTSALSKLNTNEKGFFLMVEGSQIDWASHANNAEYAIREIKDFDDAVKTALDFAEDDGETLVILTADHETGGMTMMNSSDDPKKLRVHWVTDYHTALPVPLMAYGPQAIQFSGWNDNTDIGIKIAELMNFGEFPVILE